MDIKKDKKNGYVILKVVEDLNIRSNIGELKDTVLEQVDKGNTFIALSFTPNSFLNSSGVSVCVVCVKHIRDAKGKLAIIRPNKQIKDILAITGITELVDVVNSEDDLQAPQPE
jgi:anti-anti-sigma factor